jgi:hypothetical protein
MLVTAVRSGKRNSLVPELGCLRAISGDMAADVTV